MEIEEQRTSWAICNQPMTVSPSRFRPFNRGIPRVPEDEFNEILAKLFEWLPKPINLAKR